MTARRNLGRRAITSGTKHEPLRSVLIIRKHATPPKTARRTSRTDPHFTVFPRHVRGAQPLIPDAESIKGNAHGASAPNTATAAAIIDSPSSIAAKARHDFKARLPMSMAAAAIPSVQRKAGYRGYLNFTTSSRIRSAYHCSAPRRSRPCGPSDLGPCRSRDDGVISSA
jgi:hypothetical protein